MSEKAQYEVVKAAEECEGSRKLNAEDIRGLFMDHC